MLQQLQSLLQLWQTSRSHCAHASFTSAVLTHDEQALGAPAAGTAGHRHGGERVSFTARQRKQLEIPGAAECPRTATGGSTSQGARECKGTGSAAWNFLGSSSCSVARRYGMLKQNIRAAVPKSASSNLTLLLRKVNKEELHSTKLLIIVQTSLGRNAKGQYWCL